MHWILDATPPGVFSEPISSPQHHVGVYTPSLNIFVVPVRIWKYTYSPESHICEASHNLYRHHLASDHLRRRVWKTPPRGRLAVDAICTAHSIKITELLIALAIFVVQKYYVINVKCVETCGCHEILCWMHDDIDCLLILVEIVLYWARLCVLLYRPPTDSHEMTKMKTLVRMSPLL